MSRREAAGIPSPSTPSAPGKHGSSRMIIADPISATLRGPARTTNLRGPMVIFARMVISSHSCLDWIWTVVWHRSKLVLRPRLWAAKQCWHSAWLDVGAGVDAVQLVRYAYRVCAACHAWIALVRRLWPESRRQRHPA